jgi:hypothetical protein
MGPGDEIEETIMDERPKLGEGVVHEGARPLRVVRDQAGEPWLCDRDVDASKDLESQGCWRCRDLAFTAND